MRLCVDTPYRPWATGNPPSPSPLGIFHGGIFKASEYGTIEIRLFAFKLLGLNMLKLQIRQPLPKIQFQAISQ